MPKINLLSSQVANMIAAGEVVERPASVVKELIENSLDAKADNIVVEIKSGGKEYIRVTDNGCGIDSSEVETAFLRHATSKLSKAEDLERIKTMGFRGEALAALASVSKVDMFTKTRDSEAGTHISLVAGKKELLQETGCPEGTSIVVRDLFFNVPARLKFMKKDATESAKIEEAVFNAAISSPSVAFTLIKDGKESFSTTGNGSLKDVLLSAYGKDVVSDMIFFTSERMGISLSGYIGLPSLSRANRNLQSFFINGRPIKSRIITVAVDEAYKGKMMTGKYAVVFLLLEASPASFDVNIHPQKLEVKFNYERDVFVLVRDGIISALKSEVSKDEQPPQFRIFKKDNGFSAIKPASSPYYYQSELEGSTLFKQIDLFRDPPDKSNCKPYTEPTPASKWTSPVFKKQYDNALPENTVDLSHFSKLFSAFGKPLEPEQPYEENKDNKPERDNVKILGELYHTYVAAEYKNCIFLIDKHAAHEKLIYNKLLSNRPEMMTQYLLKPHSVSVSGIEKDALLSSPDFVYKTGFEVSDAGGLGLLVRAVPEYITEDEIDSTLSEIAQRIMDNKSAETDKLDSIFKSIACKSAVKAGMKNDPAEYRKLVITTITQDGMQTCPHGRPTFIKFDESVLEKLFKRTV